MRFILHFYCLLRTNSSMFILIGLQTHLHLHIHKLLHQVLSISYFLSAQKRNFKDATHGCHSGWQVFRAQEAYISCSPLTSSTKGVLIILTSPVRTWIEPVEPIWIKTLTIGPINTNPTKTSLLNLTIPRTTREAWSRTQFEHIESQTVNSSKENTPFVWTIRIPNLFDMSFLGSILLYI